MKRTKNPAKEAEYRKRAADLVAQMTLHEKVSQMLSWAPAIERLGIPAYNWWSEGIHGVGRAGTATVFPQAIGMAAAFGYALGLRVLIRHLAGGMEVVMHYLIT